jgi:sugar lactone lactonase YvrE
LNRREIVLAGGAALAGCAHVSGTEGATAAPRLFYLGQAKVFSLDPGGGIPITLVDASPKDGSRATGVNDGIALDAARGHIYWTNMGRAPERDGYVQRCNLDGSNVTTIVARGGTFTPKQLKIDHNAGKLYWSDREGMAIQRCNLDGSNLETLVMTGDPEANKGDQARWCVGIALDPKRGQIYWTQKGGDNAGQGVIRRAGMKMPAGASASTRQDIETLFSHLPEPIDLDVDLKTRTLYWTDRGDNTISRAPMDPKAGYDPAARTDRKVVLGGLKEAIGVTLDLDRERMAYTSLGGEVGIAKLDGSEPRMLATEQGMLTGIAWA